MILVEGSRLDYSRADGAQGQLFLFTGNSYVTKAGDLVMGRGAAAEVKHRYPHVPGELGRQILAAKQRMGFYGLLWAGNIGVFQVKHHFREPAEYGLIGDSATLLATEAFAVPDLTFHMNFPGIGFGGLEYDRVLPMLASLPNNVIIYRE